MAEKVARQLGVKIHFASVALCAVAPKWAAEVYQAVQSLLHGAERGEKVSIRTHNFHIKHSPSLYSRKAN